MSEKTQSDIITLDTEGSAYLPGASVAVTIASSKDIFANPDADPITIRKGKKTVVPVTDNAEINKFFEENDINGGVN